MPTITNPGVIEAMVTAFLSNGMDKGKAGLLVGYSQSYVKNGNCAKLWDRADVRVEIKRQRTELVRKMGFTKENAHVQLDEDRDFARKCGQAGSAVSSTNTKMRLYGMDQIAPSDATVIVINPPTSVRSVESEVVDAD